MDNKENENTDKIDKPLFIDFLGKKISNYHINGKLVAKKDYPAEYIKTSRIPIDSKMLKKGKNSI